MYTNLSNIRAIIIVIVIEIGKASRAVGKGPIEIPIDCSHHVDKIVIIVPKVIRSLCAKLAKRKTPYINVMPNAPIASWQPYEKAGMIKKFDNKIIEFKKSVNIVQPPRKERLTSILARSEAPESVYLFWPVTKTKILIGSSHT